MAARVAERPETRVRWLEGLEEFNWTDTAAARTDELSNAMLDFFGEIERASPLGSVKLSGSGEVAGVTYRAAGSGSPVVLLPLGLSAHQWDACLPALEARHCVIVLGGSHLQPVQQLEARGDGDYSAMALRLLELAKPKKGRTLIEVGCGSGALLRRIVQQTRLKSVTGLDVNTFLLREAHALARRDGLAKRLRFQEGSAESIPVADASFDIAFSSTVMEEVDADRMLAEMARIVKPGGRVAVAVRAVDRGQWTNLPLPPELRRKVEAHSGGAADRGCADESLYRRFRDAGLRNISGGPAWSWVGPDDAWWANVEPQIRANLNTDEAATWAATLTEARAAALPVWLARPYHCAVGTK